MTGGDQFPQPQRAKELAAGRKKFEDAGLKIIAGGKAVPGPYLSGNPALLAEITQVSGTASDGNQKYNALQAHWRKRFGLGLESQVGYTYSHGMTDAQGYYGTSGQAAGCQVGPEPKNWTLRS